MPALEQADLVESDKSVPSTDPEVVSEAPAGGDRPHKLSIYFVLNRGKVGATSDDSPNELPVDNPASFIEVSMNFAAEESGEIHDLLRTCIGVIVQTKDGNGETKITPLPIAG